MCLRLMLSVTREAMDEDFVRTAQAKASIRTTSCATMPRRCPDFALLCALALWGAILLIVLGLIADGIVSRLDPRVRTSHGRAW
jgi:ABC-type dipeptide/oligopeptide/nickel transport system permease component